MNMTLIETIQPSTGYEDYDSDYSDECNNDDIMQVVQIGDFLKVEESKKS